MMATAAPGVGMPFDAALRTRDLAVGYRMRRTRRAVLEHVNLAVDSGELVCLLGPNGIGKTSGGSSANPRWMASASTSNAPQ